MWHQMTASLYEGLIRCPRAYAGLHHSIGERESAEGSTHVERPADVWCNGVGRCAARRGGTDNGASPTTAAARVGRALQYRSSPYVLGTGHSSATFIPACVATSTPASRSPAPAGRGTSEPRRLAP